MIKTMRKLMRNSMSMSVMGLALLSMPVTAGVARATASSEDGLTRAVSEEVSSVAQSLELESAELSREEARALGESSKWYLQQIRLRVQGKAGVEVPWIAGLEIMPEVEMIWQRSAPEGWTSYKP